MERIRAADRAARPKDEPQRRPEQPPYAALLRMQQTAGNQAVAHLLRRPETTLSPAEAVASNDPDSVSDVDSAAWATSDDKTRRKALTVLLSKSVMFPWNDGPRRRSSTRSTWTR